MLPALQPGQRAQALGMAVVSSTHQYTLHHPGGSTTVTGASPIPPAIGSAIPSSPLLGSVTPRPSSHPGGAGTTGTPGIVTSQSQPPPATGCLLPPGDQGMSSVAVPSSQSVIMGSSTGGGTASGPPGSSSSSSGAVVGSGSNTGGVGGQQQPAPQQPESLEQVIRQLPLEIQYYRQPRVLVSTKDSHVFVYPNPRWVELQDASPIYLKNLRIGPMALTVSIRTSEHRISRQVLHIVDALPLDTPYMSIQIASEKRRFIVCSWDELFNSLRNSYMRQFIRQSLPSAWMSNPFAFAMGFIRGCGALVNQTVKGTRSGGNVFEGFVTGFRLGFILFVIYTMGGFMQSLSHILNILHKLLGGSRPRPYGVLDAFWKGFNGFLLDTFWRPWVAIATDPIASVNR